MKRLKKCIAVLLLICSCFINASCWDYKDVERLSVVMCFAIDKDPNSKEYILTVEIARPESGQNLAKYMSDIYESRGATIFDAVRNLIERIGKKAYWSHVELGIFSKSVISEDITPIIDFFFRDPETRGDMYVLVSKKDTAKEILETAHNPGELRATRLRYIMENQKDLPKYPKTLMKDIFENFEGKDKAILIPLVDIKPIDSNMSEEISGSAILKYDRVIGYLNPQETQYALWAAGKLKGGLLIVPNIGGNKANMSFEVSKNNTKIKPELIEGSLKIKLDAIVTVSIGEVSGNIQFQQKGVKEEIRNEAEKVLEDRLQYVIKKTQQEYKSDIFSFGKKVQIYNKRLWKELEPRWSEEFSNLPVDVNVELIIKGSAKSSEPVKGEKAK